MVLRSEKTAYGMEQLRRVSAYLDVKGDFVLLGENERGRWRRFAGCKIPVGVQPGAPWRFVMICVPSPILLRSAPVGLKTRHTTRPAFCSLGCLLSCPLSASTDPLGDHYANNKLSGSVKLRSAACVNQERGRTLSLLFASRNEQQTGRLDVY